AGMGAVLQHLEHQGGGVGEFPAVGGLFGEAGELVEGGDVVLPADVLALAVEAAEDFVEAGREAALGGEAGVLTRRTEADDEVLAEGLALPDRTKDRRQHDVPAPVPGGAVDMIQPATRPQFL